MQTKANLLIIVEEQHWKEKGYWSFDNDTVRNVPVFGDDINSSPDIDNPKSYFLVLDEGINVSAGRAEKKLGITFKYQ